MSNHRFTPEEWTKAKREAKELLVTRAKIERTITYSELAAKIKIIQLEARDQRLFDLLGEISEEENAASRGMLSVIVVHKVGDMQPGHGFFELAKRLGRDISNQEKCWVDELIKVYASW